MRVSTVTKMAVAIILPLFLAACFFIPGKFNSTMTVEKNGKFSFAYKGELVVLSNDKPVTDNVAVDEFEASCTTKDGEDRECTSTEVAEQRKKWEADAADRAERKKINSGQAMAEVVGFNPRDPKSVEAFAAKLRQQKGWRSVVHKGDGVFEVDYAISGTLDRDFLFPNIPDVNLSVPFVVARVRNDNNVFIEAPLFGPKEEQGPNGMLSKAGMTDAPGKNKGPAPDGTFTIVTNAEILTNNTDNGPRNDSARAGWRLVSWRVTEDATKAPETLLRIQP